MSTTTTDSLPIRLSEARLAEEYVEQLRRRSYDEGEKKLMLAVLQEALNNFVQSVSAKDPVGRQSYDEVERWFLEDESEWLFSFKNICDSLGMDPAYLRTGLIRLRESRLVGSRRLEYKVKPFRLGRTAYRQRYRGLSNARINGRSGRSTINRELAARVR